MRVIDAVRETIADVSICSDEGLALETSDTPVCLPLHRRSYLALLRAGITL